MYCSQVVSAKILDEKHKTYNVKVIFMLTVYYMLIYTLML